VKGNDVKRQADKRNDPQQRLPGFSYRSTRRPLGKPDRELHAEDIALTRLAERFGTPLYVYSAATIRQRYHLFDKAFRGSEHTICYSVKANSNLSILRLLAQMGAGFDIVSGGELQRVISAARKSVRNVVFSGVGKLADEIDAALQAGILLFNIESESEMELLAARAAHLRKTANFAIRVNPDVAANTHPYISTGLHEHKFGVPWRDAAELYRCGAQKDFMQPRGVSVHIGSQITDAEPFQEAMERVVALVQSLRAERFDIRYVDAGGGLGISYEDPASVDFPREVRQYAKALATPLKGMGLHLLLEPGRAIIATAGLLLTRVIYRKRNDAKQFVIVDAAMNDLIRPALYKAYHEIVPVVPGPYTGDNVEPQDIVGPVCESGDFFARDRKIAGLAEGDLLAILDAGAYGMSLASNYNTRPRAAEVLVDGKRARLIRRRETVEDLIGPERM
jgi:diaminopimelate decarboxylase